MNISVPPKHLYLDTSVISACFDQRAPERKRMTEEFWQSLNIHEVFISTLVLEELDAAQDDLRTKMREKVKDFTVLEVTQAADELAERYMDEGIFPERYRDDAVHVAVATTNHIEFLVSWNFKHLVKVRTRQAVNLANALAGYPTIEIIAPPEL